MTDEEQLARTKERVAAMKNAQAIMGEVLERNRLLESALATARDNILRCKRYVGDGAYAYMSNSNATPKTAHANMDDMAAEATKVLGR